MTDPFPEFLAIRYGIMRKLAHSQLKPSRHSCLLCASWKVISPFTVLSTSSCPTLALSGGPEQVFFVCVIIIGFQDG